VNTQKIRRPARKPATARAQGWAPNHYGLTLANSLTLANRSGSSSKAPFPSNRSKAFPKNPRASSGRSSSNKHSPTSSSGNPAVPTSPAS